MGASGDYKCPECGFIYAQYEHDGNETFYHCDVCGWQGWKEDSDPGKSTTEESALPKALQYAKVVGDVMATLWKDEWCAEVFQSEVNGDRYLYDYIEEHGLGGVFVHLFNVDIS